MENKKMVDASKYIDNRIPFLKVDDVKNIKGDLMDRSVIVTGEADYREFSDRQNPDLKIEKLVVPVNLKSTEYLLVLNKKANARMIEVLGAETKEWVNARLGLMVAGTGMPYIMIDVLEKPGGFSNFVGGLKK
jgi:hypothetical protein